MSTRIASCSCGQLKAEVTEEPVRVSVCHCLNCQRRTGSVFAAQARFPRQHVTIFGQGTEFVLAGDEGTKATFTFCPRCGATVFYVMDAVQDVVAIPIGAFADPTFPTPTTSVFEERMHSWLSLPDDMEHIA